MIRTYFTLREVLEKVNAWTDDYISGAGGSFQDFLSNCYIDNLTDQQSSATANTLWCRFLAGRYANEYICYQDNNNELEVLTCKQVAHDILRIFNLTADKYMPIITIYKNEVNNLMAPVEQSSESKYNDTPQNAQGTYSWSDDDHLSSVTRNTSSTDFTTKMARIAEIQDNLISAYTKWSDEFRRMVIYE